MLNKLEFKVGEKTVASFLDRLLRIALPDKGLYCQCALLAKVPSTTQ